MISDQLCIGVITVLARYLSSTIQINLIYQNYISAGDDYETESNPLIVNCCMDIMIISVCE